MRSCCSDVVDQVVWLELVIFLGIFLRYGRMFSLLQSTFVDSDGLSLTRLGKVPIN